MLQGNKPRLVTVSDDAVMAPEFVSPAELYAAIEGFLRRQFPIVLFVALLVLGLGAVYLFTTPARYTGHAVLVIDTHKTQVFQQQSPLGDLPIDSATVDTQIEILKSDNIAQAVVKDLHLNEDAEFIHPPSGFISSILGAVTNLLTFSFSSGPPASESQLTRAAMGNFQGHLAVKRVGLTYAIDIDFQSLHPERAAQIANAVADAYVVDALEAKYQTTRRAAIWLQDRLKELREQAANAERAVVDYKAKNNIIDTGGRLLNDQQLAELNSALIQARAQTAETKARLDRVTQILNVDNLDPASPSTATVADSLSNAVIVKLRNQYLEYKAREADFSKRYGADHLAAVNLRNQMREIRRSILDELQRIAETYKSDYAIAKTREESVQKSLDEIVSQSQITKEAQITLHGLDSSAQTYRALYDSFLQRYMESVQQQSFPVTEARLITTAVPPGAKSSPKTSLVLAVAAFGGVILGLGAGLLREVADRVFRTSSQVEERLETDCLAVVPRVTIEAKGAMLDPVPGPAHLPAVRVIAHEQSLLWTVVDQPFSRFSESIRAIKVAADLRKVVKENKVIAVTSSLPNEGKSTISMALAQLIAHTGSRVVLVDCDLRNPSLTRHLAPAATVGLLDLVAGKAFFDEIAWTDPATKLTFLPATVKSRVAHTAEILASPAMRKIFERLRETFDYVIVDLSPLAPVVDVRAMTHLIDSFVFVVEWGRTKIDVAEHALRAAPGVHENLLGAVLNKADMNSLGRYEAYRGNYYYKRYYARYGYTD